jgi:4-amino-4-deoxy-L-arabinose transferase-like glycosyltransferase
MNTSIEFRRALTKRRFIPIAILALATGCLYFHRLAWSPPNLSIEEVTQARHAFALATTGRSLSGQRWPLYPAEPRYPPGWEPIGIYSTAALLRFVPFSETVIRTPSVVAGLINVVLMFVVARRVFRNDSVAMGAAVLLALTPGHVVQSRVGTSQIVTETFELCWLLFLAKYLAMDRLRDLVLAVTSLGIGVYSYPAALVVMPLYFLGTLVVVLQYRSRARSDRVGAATNMAHLSIACGAFFLALVPWCLWQIAHPQRLSQLADYYTHNGYNEDLGLKSFWTAAGVTRHLDVWWNVFNPDRLFFSGDSSLRFSTRQAGYLLLPMSVFFAIGLWRLRRTLDPAWRFLIVGGLLVAPIPAALVTQYEFKRWLTILPFVTLATICGVRYALASRHRIARAAAVTLVALAVVQFGSFFHDYLTDYRSRSNFWFGGNLRGAIRDALDGPRDPRCVFLDQRINFLEEYWNLYTRVYGRESFGVRPVFVDIDRADFVDTVRCREGSLMVLADAVRSNAILRESLAAHGWHATPIAEPDGSTYLYVYHRIVK